MLCVIKKYDIIYLSIDKADKVKDKQKLKIKVEN